MFEMEQYWCRHCESMFDAVPQGPAGEFAECPDCKNDDCMRSEFELVEAEREYRMCSNDRRKSKNVGGAFLASLFGKSN